MEKPAVHMTYGIKDKPKLGEIALAAVQQLLAIMVATIAVPAAVGNGLSASAALFGAGCGTMIYLLFTKSSSPVFLGSSFAFIGPMLTAFAGAASMAIGYAGLIIGAAIAALVYVIIALVVKFCGVKWIDKLMPPVVIGPTVAIIGLSLSSYAISLLMSSDIEGGNPQIGLLCGLVTLVIAMLVSTFGKKTMKLIPFMVGIVGGYFLASLLYLIGKNTGNVGLQVINYSAFNQVKSIISLPDFTFLKADWNGISAGYLLTLFVAYAPVAFVVFAEHLADHKNLSSIIGVNLLEEPGLTRTLLGDGIGSAVGTFFGGCPNTTYGESIACVALTGNASTISIWGAAIAAIIFSLITPLVAFLETIPSCVMGGVCVALYGFIASSGFKMFQSVDLNKNRNLYTACVIFIVGVGGMTVSFGTVEIRTVACALILGILTNLMLAKEKD
ncbi:MAG: uracil-xanthine permease [Oscillospiraceae bacterium]|nr:uracil-xanthine permease [Oscillospiraceae bacterium]